MKGALLPERSRGPRETAVLGSREAYVPRLVLIGGDERCLALTGVVAGLRVFPSARFAGSGSITRALATISSGTADIVVVLCRWLGHSDYHAIARLCRQQGVQLLRVQGGFSAARKVIAKARGEA